MNNRKKAWRGMIGIASLVLCGALLFRCQMVACAYTEEEKEAAKQWLSQNGYSPDMGGANQAYQDYLNGKFDNQMPGNNNNQGDSQNGSQTPNDENGTQTPDTQNGTQNQETPDSEGNSSDSQTPDTQSGDNSGTSTDGTGTSDSTNKGSKDKNSKNDKSKNSEGSNTKKNSNNEKDNTTGSSGNTTSNIDGTGATSTDSGQSQNENGTASTQQDGQTLTSDMPQEQEAAVMSFVLTQLATENKKTVTAEEREQREAELYEQSLVASAAVSENESTDDAKDENKSASANKETEKSSNVFQIWIVISVVAVIALGGICFLVMRKH